ncbi:hypothetical protein F4819DRAFT_491721 [Hypoxylon fuscum]|nr:hypothetical protein F4819DRAFT_491721 [Hypoxylon fuscum]
MVASNVRVPRLFSILNNADDEFWDKYLPMFPTHCRSRGTLVQIERILPLPKITRKALITYFYPHGSNSVLDSDIIQLILEDTPNKHCLARTYLGRDHGAFPKEEFSLRNFPLYLSSMERLGLDVVGLAISMGKAYAIMHWGAGVNGDDVEFVLGTSTARERGHGGDAFQHRAVGLYLLDFGQCELVDLSEDPDVVYQAFKGAMVTGDNQLFIPHYQRSPKLFSAFGEAYLDAGQRIIVDKKLEKNFNMEEFMKEYEEYAEDFLF